jgi:hypothetical protein
MYRYFPLFVDTVPFLLVVQYISALHTGLSVHNRKIPQRGDYGKILGETSRSCASRAHYPRLAIAIGCEGEAPGLIGSKHPYVINLGGKRWYLRPRGLCLARLR